MVSLERQLLRLPKLRSALLLTVPVLLLGPPVSAAPAHFNVAQRLHLIERQTQQIRGLKQLRPVKVYFPTDKAFDADLMRDTRRDTPESDIRTGQQELLELGEIGPHDSLHKIIYSGITAQVIGFYSRHDRVFYARRQTNSILGPERWVVAHEYTHALQDQHYNLTRLIPNVAGVAYRNTDAIGAHHALTEGDAVVTQILFRDRTYTQAEKNRLYQIESHQPKTPKLPVTIQRQFDFAYTYGFNFAKVLYLQRGMRGIDGAYARLPSSTYEIMHPASYVRGWRPVNVVLHRVSGVGGWQQTDDDVFGAMNYQELLWQWLPRERADRVVNGYRGDRYVFLVHGGQHAMLFHSVWTNASTARAARAAFVAALRLRYHAAHLFPGPILTVKDKDGAVAFKLSGSRLSMAYGPSPAIARKLAAAHTS